LRRGSLASDPSPRNQWRQALRVPSLPVAAMVGGQIAALRLAAAASAPIPRQARRSGRGKP